MRNRAIKILDDNMSEITSAHIEKIAYLKDWIVNAMVEFHKQEIRNLNLDSIDNKMTIDELNRNFKFAFDEDEFYRIKTFMESDS